MAELAGPVTHLVEQFKKLPGIGSKSAHRMAFFVLKMGVEEAEQLAGAIVDVKRSIRRCSECCNLTDVDPCAFCTDPKRQDSVICVVEESHNILPVERTHGFNGRYHVLMGTISPFKGIGPDQLSVKALVERIARIQPQEVILAMNPNAEGETTAVYISRLLKPLGIRVTRLAQGLPMGGDLEFADQSTMSKALEGRREI